MMLTIKPFGAVDPTVLEFLCKELGSIGEVSLSPADRIPDSFLHRNREGQTQYLASEFEKALAPVVGDRVLAVTDVDLFERGLNFVFGHATIRDRFAVISVARFGTEGPEKLLERSLKTAIHELGHTLGLHHDDANSECVMHFSEGLEDTDRKGVAFCPNCATTASIASSHLQT